MISHLALVCNMGVTEEEVMIPDASGCLGSSAAMDGHVLAEGIIVANNELGLAAFVFEILSKPACLLYTSPSPRDRG